MFTITLFVCSMLQQSHCITLHHPQAVFPNVFECQQELPRIARTHAQIDIPGLALWMQSVPKDEHGRQPMMGGGGCTPMTSMSVDVPTEEVTGSGA